MQTHDACRRTAGAHSARARLQTAPMSYSLGDAANAAAMARAVAESLMSKNKPRSRRTHSAHSSSSVGAIDSVGAPSNVARIARICAAVSLRTEPLPDSVRLTVESCKI